jgi:hypothetical protein
MYINIYKLLLLFPLVCLSQKKKTSYYDTIVVENLRKYIDENDLAVRENDEDRLNFLFDSLINNHLKNSLIRNKTLKRARKGKFSFSKTEKPLILITKSPWNHGFDDEIETINDLAKELRKKATIVVLYWTDKSKATKYAKKYNSNVIVTFLDERENVHNNFIRSFKHVFGAPCCYLINPSKHLVNIIKTENIDYITENHSTIIEDLEIEL